MTDARDVVADRAVTRVLDGSVLFRPADRLLARVSVAASDSRLASRTSAAVARWHGWAPAERRKVVGATMLAAVAVHLGLTMWHAIPPGWMWLVLPAQATIAGLVLLATNGKGALRAPK